VVRQTIAAVPRWDDAMLAGMLLMLEQDNADDPEMTVLFDIPSHWNTWARDLINARKETLDPRYQDIIEQASDD
jgi:hypothetical protein